MNYYYQQQLNRHSLANDKNSSVSPEHNPQQQFITRRDEPPNSFVTMTYKPYLLREDGEQKIPLFLIKLWNIVEDPSHWEVIRWDETGLSFHIMKPYVFCSDILPYYFKHKNLNSLVRQLNMYGFRKNTPIERSGLARAESDQDHLEFFHPFFRRDHPELLNNIHRKVPNSAKQQMQHRYHHHQQQQLQVVANVGDVIGGGTAMDVGREETVALQTKDLTNIFDELRTMRERQKNMEMRMDELTKENEMLWNEMAHIRGTHLKQQQIVNKLIQFLVALVGPAAAAGKQSHRLGKKRHMYVLEDFGAKRLHECVVDGGRGSIPSPASMPAAGGSGSGYTNGGAGPVNAPPFYSTTGRFPSTNCFASTSAAAAPAVPSSATSIVPGRSASTGGAEPVSTTAATTTTHASQLQSLLPANATEILDRLISEIASSRGDAGGLEGIQIDDLSSPPSTASTNGDQQIQSYVNGGSNFEAALSTIRPNRSHSMHMPSSNSGPIIAEVVEESDALSAVDPSNIGGGGRIPFQPGVVPPPPPPLSSSPQQLQQQMVESQQRQQVQQQQHSSAYQSYIENVVGRCRQQHQTKYSKRDGTNDGGVTYQQQQLQQQQQLVVYQPTQPHIMPQPMFQQRPKQQQLQQQLVVLPYQPMTTTTTTIQHMGVAAAQQTGKQQQVQQSALPVLNTPNQHNQQQRMCHQSSPVVVQRPMNALVDQQSTSANELQNLLLTPPIAQQEATTHSLGDGMMLNDTEMADIAGLNAFLDENSARFNSLTNSIGEHWVNAVDDNDLQLQDLFRSVEELSSSNPEQNVIPTNGQSEHPSSAHMSDEQQHLFGGDEHLDFPFETGNGDRTE